ncbi:hypothetical protein G6F57_017319 [Rhizopus arrhizus]|nr:hypothetical protein G6F57_017319 [Rhizopus arrhizus]
MRTANVTVGGVTLIPHSIYVAVVGGAAASIADAIWRKKSNWADYNGNTSYTVQDTAGYDFPYPSYVVKWQTPTALPVLFAVQIANNPSLPSNIVALTKQAIIAAFNGAEGGLRARIGSTLFASRYYAPIVAIDPSISIISLLLGTTSPTLPSVTIPINRTPTISEANITVSLV